MGHKTHFEARRAPTRISRLTGAILGTSRAGMAVSKKARRRSVLGRRSGMRRARSWAAMAGRAARSTPLTRNGC